MGSNRLLIVDDDRDFAALVARVAEGCGFETRRIANGLDLDDAVTGWQPTAITLDLNMPDIDGLEALHRFEAMGCTARILIMSGQDARVTEAARRVGLERGLEIIGCLTKPVHLADLRTALCQLLDGHEDTSLSELHRALRRNELFLAYQPKVAIGDGRLHGVEALLRWHHPVRGLQMPDSFIALAEKSGVIDPVTDFVLARAIAQQAAWRQTAGLDLEVAVNLSALNLLRGTLADDIAALCQRHGVRPDRITLEITETAAMTDQLRALDVLTRLRLKGFGIAIDDFGIGFSSLARLQRLPVTEIKIDRSFVAECTSSTSAAAIVRSVVQLADNLGMTAVAEGIETEAQHAVVASARCRLGQGFGIARPMAADCLPGWAAGVRPGGAAG